MSNEIVTDTSPTFFSGWRPLIGWISVFSLALQFIFFPIVEVVAALLGFTTPFPRMDIAPLIALVTSVLGMGGLRTIEKLSDVHSR